MSFRKNGVWPSLYDVAVSWLRLQTPIDCIPHPYWIQSVLAHLVEMLWMGISWVHPYAGIHCSGVDNGYHDLPHQAVSIEGVLQLLQGMPAVCSI